VVYSLGIDPLTEFFDALDNPLTRRYYERRIRVFFAHAGIEGKDLGEQASAFVRRAKEDPTYAYYAVTGFVRFEKERVERGEITAGTLTNFVKAVKLFCEQNDIMLNWKKISRKLPRVREYASDRAPTREEILRWMEYPDRRIKPIILLMVSSGIRLGAWDYLRWKDIEPVYAESAPTSGGGQPEEPVAARLTVYRGTEEEYTTYITPEAYLCLKEWMEYRAGQGERVTPESWLMRDLWDTTTPRGLLQVNTPRKLRSSGVKRLLERSLFAQGLRKPLPPGKRRHEFQGAHGFRKFFKSVCEKHMKSLHVEILMGHNVGLAESYYRPQEREILEDYLKAVPELTFYAKKEDAGITEVEALREKIRRMEEEQKKKDEQILGLLAELGRVVEELKEERLRELSPPGSAGRNRGEKGRRH